MLQLFRPVQSNRVNQGFGENSVCAKTVPGGFPHIPFQVVNKVQGVCPQGSRDFYKLLGMVGHDGVDQSAWLGEPTYHCALFKGKAQTPPPRPNGKPDTDGGLNVISDDAVLECTQGCPAGTVHHALIRYAHGVMKVADGSSVNPGDFVQTVGDIGSSTGTHLHWSLKASDPTGHILHLDNGYEGAINPKPYYQNIFIIDYLTEQKKLPPAQQSPAIVNSPIPQPVPLTMGQTIIKLLFQAAILLQRLVGLITTSQKG